MPVIIVTAPPLGDTETELAALSSLALAVSEALDLPPEAVHVSLVRAAAGVLGATPVQPWPVVVLHGSPRPAAERAALAAQQCAAAAWQRPVDEVWVQWLTT